MRPWVVAAAAAVGALVAAVAIASGPDPDSVPTPESVAQRVMSPFCPGLTLDECPSNQAAELKATIAAKTRAGTTNREIDEWIVRNYGESALARPKRTAAWLGPALAASLGLLAVLYLLRRSRTPVTPAPPEITEADRDRVRQDMLQFFEGANE